jgi:molybdopterin-containing oxidoreductase family membrane subunit
MADLTNNTQGSAAATPATVATPAVAQPALQPKPRKKAFAVALIVTGVLAVFGIVVWFYQIFNGLGVTGMNNGNSWGLYIALFMLFVGLSAGGMIVVSSASIFHIEKFKVVAVPATILSIICICIAAAFVMIDMGGVYRVLELLWHPQMDSPLMWDVIVITLYLIVNIVYLVLMMKKGVNSHAVAVTSRFALPIAILVHSVTGWIFGLQIAKAWYTALMAPLFVISALDSGLALLLIVLVVLKKLKVFDTPKELITSFAGLMAACVALDGFFVFCEVITMAYPAGTSGADLMIMLSGQTAPFFWFEVASIVIAFCLMVFQKLRENTAAVMVASVLIVLGVLCKRLWLLLTSFVTYNIAGAPGVTIGNPNVAIQNSQIYNVSNTGIWTNVSQYAPTWVEYAIVLGVLALGVFVYLILAKKCIIDHNKKLDAQTAAAPAPAAAATA